MSLLMTKAFRRMFSKNFLSLKQAYLFQKNSGPKKLKKSPPPKKLKGHFEQKTQCFGVNLRFQLKNLRNLRLPKKLKGHFEQKNSVCWSQLEVSAKKTKEMLTI